MFGRYAKFMFAPDSGADGGGVGADRLTTGAEIKTAADIDTTDYKALYEKEVAERAKLKKSFDATASEIAELKKANKAKMSEEEQKELDRAEERKYWEAQAIELREIKTTTIFAKNGYDEKDYADLTKTLIDACGDKAYTVADSIVEFAKRIAKNAVANAKNGMIKDSAIPPKASNATAEEHTYAKLATENNAPSNKSNDIKNYYRKNK